MSNCNRGSNSPCNSPCSNNESMVVENVLNQASFCRLCYNTNCAPNIIPVDFEWKMANNRLCFLLCCETCGPNAVCLCNNQPVTLEIEHVCNNTLFSIVCKGRVTRTCCSCWQDDTKFIEVAVCDVDVRTFPASGPSTCNC